MKTPQHAVKQKKSTALLWVIFILLIGIIPLVVPHSVHGFSFTDDIKPWITGLFSRSKPTAPPQSINTSWVKDFLAKNPQYTEEDIVKRDAYSVHMKKPDGKIEAHFAQKPINYKNSQGQWETLDTAITPSDNSYYDYQNVTNDFQTFFSSDVYQDTGNIKLVKGDASLTITTIDKLTFADRNETFTLSDLIPKTEEEKQAKKGVVDAQEQNKICYPALYEKDGKTMDVCYIVTEGRIQEQLILNAYQGYPELTQTIILTNAYAKKEGKQITFYNATTNELLWYILDPVIYEQNECEDPLAQKPARFENRDLHYDLACNQRNTPLERCSHLSIKKILEPKAKEFLADPQRRYPVTIDPDYADSTDDAFIYGYDANYTTSHTTVSGYYLALTDAWVGMKYNGIYDIDRMYLKFATSGIPDNATVTQVNLKLVAVEDDSTTNFDVDIIKQNWSAQEPLTSGYEAAYDNCLSGTLDANIWRNTNGMSINTQYTSGNLDTSYVSPTGTYTYYCLISSRDKAGNTPTGDEYIKVAQQEHATSGYRPILTVTYTTGKANGESCTTNGECTSNNCVDLTCCDTTCTGSLCQRCDSTYVTTGGTCSYVKSATDPDSDCGILDCDGGATKYYYGWSSTNYGTCYYMLDVSANNAVCTGSSYACKTAATMCPSSTQGASTGVTATACQTVTGCTGTTAGSVTGNVTAGTDPNNGCASYSCTSKVYGWSTVYGQPGNDCEAATAAANDGDCNGSGACYTTFADSCTSGGSTLASCGSAGCKNASACVQDSASTTSDTAGEICYTSGQHSCPDGQECDATGTCIEPTCASIPPKGDHVVTGSCHFPYTTIVNGSSINGLDTGSGTTNTAKLTIGSVGTPGYLTVKEDQMLAVGSIQLVNGSITIIKGTPGGQIKLKTPLYLPDADGDGYPTSDLTTQYTSAATGRVRRNVTSDTNDTSKCADADTNTTPDSALYNMTCRKCVTGGSTFQITTEDIYSQCAPTTCSGNVWGWSSTSCKAAADAASNGLCDGAGACVTGVANACTAGSTITSCPSAGCVNASACVQGSASTTSDTVAEICYTSAQHSCSTGYACDATGTCVVAANITRVQYKHQYEAVSGTGYAFTSNNTAGNFIVVAVSGLGTPTSMVISDTQGNTYTALQLNNSGDEDGLQLFYAANIKAGANSVKATYSGWSDVGFTAVEYSGIATSNPLDVEATPLHSNTATKTFTSNSFNPQTGSLIFAAWSDHHYFVLGAVGGTGITVFQTDTGQIAMEGENLSATSGSQTVAFTASNNSTDYWMVNVAAFKAAAGGPTPTPSPTPSPTPTPAITRVQYKYAYEATSGTEYAFPSNNTQHNFIVVFVSGSGTTGTGLGISDTQGNTYTGLTLNNSGPARNGRLYYAADIKGGANSVKVTYTDPNWSDVGFTAVEYSGIATSNPFDVEATPKSVQSITNTPTSNSFNPQTGDLVFAAWGSGSSNPGTVTGTGMTVFRYTGNHYEAEGENLSATTGSQTVTFNTTNNVEYWILHVAAFKHQ